METTSTNSHQVFTTELECSCKNISIQWSRVRDGSDQILQARSCQCDYCSQQQAEYVSDSSSSFTYKVARDIDHTIVQHGHNTAKFHECNHCGLAFVSSTIGGQTFGIINAIVMGLNNYALKPIPQDYSSETLEERLNRRQNRWCKLRS